VTSLWAAKPGFKGIGREFSHLSSAQTVHPVSYPEGTSWNMKNTIPSNGIVKNVWIYTSTLLYNFMEQWLN
jgi:hypothetical protein